MRSVEHNPQTEYQQFVEDAYENPLTLLEASIVPRTHNDDHLALTHLGGTSVSLRTFDCNRDYWRQKSKQWSFEHPFFGQFPDGVNVNQMWGDHNTLNTRAAIEWIRTASLYLVKLMEADNEKQTFGEPTYRYQLTQHNDVLLAIRFSKRENHRTTNRLICFFDYETSLQWGYRYTPREVCGSPLFVLKLVDDIKYIQKLISELKSDSVWLARKLITYEYTSQGNVYDMVIPESVSGQVFHVSHVIKSSGEIFVKFCPLKFAHGFGLLIVPVDQEKDVLMDWLAVIEKQPTRLYLKVVQGKKVLKISSAKTEIEIGYIFQPLLYPWYAFFEPNTLGDLT